MKYKLYVTYRILTAVFTARRAFGFWEKLMWMNTDNTLTILFRLNLINFYGHRHDCHLACSNRLAEQFQMHSFEPEGLQLTYRETQVKIIKEASAALGTA